MTPFLSVSIALIVGILMGQLMGKLRIPAVAGYILAGLVVGVSGFKLVNQSMIDSVSFLSDFALGIIAFNIGSEFKLSQIKSLGKPIFIIALLEALGAFVLVTSVMLLAKQTIATALILGAVSSATAPAATVMVLKEFNAKGPLTSTLLGVVAVDDAICLMIYAIAAAIAKVFINHEVVTAYKVLIFPVMEIVLSLLMGAFVGTVLTLLLRTAKRQAEMLSFVVGAIMLVVGIALKYPLSPLLAAMAMGVVVANISPDSRRAFSVIEDFSPPVIAAFFTLAGARLDVKLLPHVGLVGVAYLVFRIAGKMLGAMAGGAISQAPGVVQKYIGLGLLSQVGVAVGLAVVVGREFPGTSLGTLVITILLATTVVTEIVGPLATKMAVIKAGEGHV